MGIDPKGDDVLQRHIDQSCRVLLDDGDEDEVLRWLVITPNGLAITDRWYCADIEHRRVIRNVTLDDLVAVGRTKPWPGKENRVYVFTESDEVPLGVVFSDLKEMNGFIYAMQDLIGHHRDDHKRASYRTPGSASSVKGRASKLARGEAEAQETRSEISLDSLSISNSSAVAEIQRMSYMPPREDEIILPITQIRASSQYIDGTATPRVLEEPEPVDMDVDGLAMELNIN